MLTADASDALFAADRDDPDPTPPPAEPPTLDRVPLQVLVRPGEIDGHAVQVRVQSADRRPFLAALSAIDRGVEAELADARAEYLAGAGQELVAARERLAGAKTEAGKLAGDAAAVRDRWTRAVAAGDDVAAARHEARLDELDRVADRANARVKVLAEVVSKSEADAGDGLRGRVECTLSVAYDRAKQEEAAALDALAAAVTPAFRAWLAAHTRRVSLGSWTIDRKGVTRFAKLPGAASERAAPGTAGPRDRATPLPGLPAI